MAGVPFILEFPVSSASLRSIPVWFSLALALPLLACGQTDDSKISPSELPNIVTEEPIGGTRVSEDVIDDEEEIGESVRDTEFADNWKGGYRAHYVEVTEATTRVELRIDIYKSEQSATKRFDAERELTQNFFRLRLSEAVVVNDLPASLPPACKGFSVEMTGVIVPLYEVYCQTDTIFLSATATSRDRDEAVDLVGRIAPGIASRLESAFNSNP
jgi:hypothetical protein